MALGRLASLFAGKKSLARCLSGQRKLVSTNADAAIATTVVIAVVVSKLFAVASAPVVSSVLTTRVVAAIVARKA